MAAATLFLRLLLMLLAVAAAAATTAGGGGDPPPRATTALGAVEGLYNDAGGASFLGIPYGDSVSGAHRWTAPRPAPAWAPAVLNATTPPPGCPASSGAAAEVSEDCLRLNVYVPPEAAELLQAAAAAAAAAASSASASASASAAAAVAAVAALQLPVVFWVHGGGFFIGNVSKPLWQGEFLVGRGAAAGRPVIMVSPDYRLGALGFLASPPLNLTGNYGFLDQQLALRWVRNNIAAFGGDAARVTLHGQSAGAMSAHLHLVSPGSAGLFHRAHIRSDVGLHYRNLTEAQHHAAVLTVALLCEAGGAAERLACLRAKPAAAVVKAQGAPEYIALLTEPGFGLNFLEWLPVVDGSVLPGNPLALLQAGQVNPGVEAVVIGTMMNESLAFAPWKLLGGLKGLEAEAFLSLFLDVQFDAHRRADLRKLYDGSSTSAVTQATTILTDYLFTCYCNAVAEALAAHTNISTYVYTFRHIPSDRADPDNHEGCRPEQWNAACHAGDNMFAFGTDSICENASFTPFEKQLSNLYVDVDVNLTAAAPGAVADAFGIFGSKFDPAAPTQVIFGSTTAPLETSLFHVETAAPGLHCDYMEQIGWR